MTSDRATHANRLNAKASTGPRTRAGKERSAQNARKHGLSAAGANSGTTAEVDRLITLFVAEYGDDDAFRDAYRSLAKAQGQVRSIRVFKTVFLTNNLLKQGQQWQAGRDLSGELIGDVIRILEGLERYERRAFSRRKSALRRLIDLVQ